MMASRLTRVPLLVVLLVGASALVAPPAAAATISVTQGDDADTGPGCTLRQAIRAANADAGTTGCAHPGVDGPDIIELPPGTYSLTRQAADDDDAANGDLDITEDLTIVGAGADVTTIDGGGLTNERVVHVLAGVVAEISGVTITGGSDNTGNGGGGVFNQGTLTLDEVDVRDNASSGGGGGVATSGTLTVRASLIRNNKAGLAGGGILQTVGTLTMRHSTVSGNTADGGGGGISSTGDGSITHATITKNEADTDGAGFAGDGGGLVETGTLTLARTVIAGNTDGSPGAEKPDCDSVGLTSDGHNVIGDSSGCTFNPPDATSVVDQNAGLAPSLQDNGGPTQTHGLMASSVARDLIPAGDSACGGKDQRGVPRPQAAGCDAGAYEYAVCMGRLVNVVGTAGPDDLVGTAAADGVLGLGGSDDIRTRGGPDRACGGSGGDEIRLGRGRDRARGDAGRDLLVGGGQRDVLRGNGGDDDLKGKAGPDLLFGAAGNDLLAGGPGTDTCRQGSGSGRTSGCEV